jgi:hypothetical protein
MPNPIDVGTGVTVVFGTSGFSGYLLNIDGPEVARVSVETTHYGTTGGKTFRPGDLYDPGEIALEFAFDPDLSVPIFNAEQPETVTITWPIPAGKSSGATWSASCFCLNYKPSAPLEDKMTATMTLKVTGNITRVAST